MIVKIRTNANNRINVRCMLVVRTQLEVMHAHAVPDTKVSNVRLYFILFIITRLHFFYLFYKRNEAQNNQKKHNPEPGTKSLHNFSSKSIFSIN